MQHIPAKKRKKTTVKHLWKTFSNMSFVSKIAISGFFLGITILVSVSGENQLFTNATGLTNTPPSILADGTVCASDTNRSCGYTDDCHIFKEGTLCERKQSCQANGDGANDVFVCKAGKWAFYRWNQKPSCNYCSAGIAQSTVTPGVTISAVATTNTPSPTITTSPTGVTAVPISPIIIPNGTTSLYLFGSNLGAWGQNADGSINEPFMTSSGIRNLAKGVISIFRFPTYRNWTDAQVLAIVASIRSVGAEPLVIVDAQNITKAVHMAQLLNGKATYFEYGNEDNYFKGWNGTTYASYYLQAVPQMRAVNPGIKIGGPAVSDIGTNGSQYIRDFLTAIKGNTSMYPAFISGHIYIEHGEGLTVSNQSVLQKAAGVGGRIAAVKNDMQTILGESLPIAITEWNWNAQPENQQHPDNRDTDVQFMHDFTTTVLDQFRSQGVWMATQWDFASGACGGHCDVVSTSGQAKPQYTIFKAYRASLGM